MVDEIGRLRIVCIADPARSSAALAVRRRLEVVARHHLAPAIDRQVGANRRLDLARLAVRLDFDPLDYDNESIATLWASRIVAAIQAAAGLPGTATAADGEFAGPPLSSRHAGEAAAESAVVNLARRSLAGDRAVAIELARTVIADPGVTTAELGATLTPPQRRSLVARLATLASVLERRRRTGPVARRPTAIHLGDESAPSASHAPGRSSWAASLLGASRRLVLADRRTAIGERPQRAAGRRPSKPAERSLRDGGEPASRSAVAGLALLWPWLAAHASAAVERLPDRDPAAVRRLALASLVPDELNAVDDPLVRLLAGDDVTDEPALIYVTSSELALAAEDAAALLSSFAATLPGFADSSAEFVRREFLVRTGTIERRGTEVVIRIGVLPLDPMLEQLPYPIESFRLPWTPPLRVRLETT